VRSWSAKKGEKAMTDETYGVAGPIIEVLEYCEAMSRSNGVISGPAVADKVLSLLRPPEKFEVNPNDLDTMRETIKQLKSSLDCAISQLKDTECGDSEIQRHADAAGSALDEVACYISDAKTEIDEIYDSSSFDVDGLLEGAADADKAFDELIALVNEMIGS
jgi:hypothetical protein